MHPSNPAGANSEPFANAQLYRVRDDLARQFNPVGQFELMLVTQAARAYIRLQRAHEAEDRAFAEMDPLEMLTSKVATFKLLTKFVNDSERMWNRALAEIRRAQRSRHLLSQPGKGPNFEILKPRPQHAATPSSPDLAANGRSREP